MTVIDWNVVGSEDDTSTELDSDDEIGFVRNNHGDGKLLPEGPVCFSKGK